MSKLKDFYQRSQWNNVFHFRDDRGSARSNFFNSNLILSTVHGNDKITHNGYPPQ